MEWWEGFLKGRKELSGVTDMFMSLIIVIISCIHGDLRILPNYTLKNISVYGISCFNKTY
jgi:hypothetical protein